MNKSFYTLEKITVVKKTLWLLLALALWGSTAIPDVRAQATPFVLCRFEPSTIGVSSTAILIVEVRDIQNLQRYELVLPYNSAQIEFIDADLNRGGVNVQLGAFLAADFVMTNEANPTDGRLRLSVSQVAPRQAVTGTGELVRTTVRGLQVGSVNFNFENVALFNQNNQQINTQSSGCSLTITDAATPTATTIESTSIQPTPTETPTLFPVDTPTPQPVFTEIPVVVITPTETPFFQATPTLTPIPFGTPEDEIIFDDESDAAPTPTLVAFEVLSPPKLDEIERSEGAQIADASAAPAAQLSSSTVLAVQQPAALSRFYRLPLRQVAWIALTFAMFLGSIAWWQRKRGS